MKFCAWIYSAAVYPLCQIVAINWNIMFITFHAIYSYPNGIKVDSHYMFCLTCKYSTSCAAFNYRERLTKCSNAMHLMMILINLLELTQLLVCFIIYHYPITQISYQYCLFQSIKIYYFLSINIYYFL